MSRFINYTDELNEKVSKKEIDDALKNTNVIIGQEFEMKIPFDGMGEEIDELYKKASQEYDQWYKDVNEYEEKNTEYYQETEEKKEELSDLEDAISSALPYSEENGQNEGFTFQDWLDGAMEEWIHDSNLAEVYKTIGEKPFKPADLNTLEFLEDIVGVMESEKDNLENDILYREDEGQYEQTDSYMPNLIGYKYQNYVEYMQEYQFVDIEDDVKNGKYMPGDGDDIPRLAHPDDLGMGGTPDYEEVLNLDDAPFTKYEIGAYQQVSQSVGSGVWAIEDDESLGSNGVEIKSPPMVAPIAIKNMDDMFDWMTQNNYYTDNSCGFHAHLSLKGVKDLTGILNPLKNPHKPAE